MREPTVDSTLDSTLVVASVAGDVRAFERLVERHHRAVVAVAFAISRDLALAEDAAQETFVVAWTRMIELREPGHVRPWLCKIARNVSRNQRRRHGREVAVSEATLAVADGRPSPADVVLAREAEAELR